MTQQFGPLTGDTDGKTNYEQTAFAESIDLPPPITEIEQVHACRCCNRQIPERETEHANGGPVCYDCLSGSAATLDVLAEVDTEKGLKVPTDLGDNFYFRGPPEYFINMSDERGKDYVDVDGIMRVVYKSQSWILRRVHNAVHDGQYELITRTELPAAVTPTTIGRYTGSPGPSNVFVCTVCQQTFEEGTCHAVHCWDDHAIQDRPDEYRTVRGVPQRPEEQPGLDAFGQS